QLGAQAPLGQLRQFGRVLLAGQQRATKLAELAQGRLRAKLAPLKLALEGHCTEHHRYLLGRLLRHLGYLEGQSALLGGRIAHRLGALLPEEDRVRLDGIPGVNATTIENVIAEVGVDMAVFPDEHHLCSWCGICPGSEESAGKRLRSRTRKGNRWLRRALAEAAGAASPGKGRYLAGPDRPLAAPRGARPA